MDVQISPEIHKWAELNVNNLLSANLQVGHLLKIAVHELSVLHQRFRRFVRMLQQFLKENSNQNFRKSIAANEVAAHNSNYHEKIYNLGEKKIMLQGTSKTSLCESPNPTICWELRDYALYLEFTKVGILFIWQTWENVVATVSCKCAELRHRRRAWWVK